ncbi:MAG: hypothetical protein E6626_05910 [Flavonifractor plautii]|nr:hypothetical protein [Flavonifractor plautii]
MLIGIGLAVAVIVLIDAALRPTVTELAKAKVKNAVTSIINDAVNETLSSEAISYGDLVTLEKRYWAGYWSRWNSLTVRSWGSLWET